MHSYESKIHIIDCAIYLIFNYKAAYKEALGIDKP